MLAELKKKAVVPDDIAVFILVYMVISNKTRLITQIFELKSLIDKGLVNK